VWGILALRQAREPVSAQAVRFVTQAQQRSGGYAWASGLRPDTDDTAAAVQALAASGVHGTPIKRALAYLRTRQRPDGGFELQPGAGSNVQSTSWAIQAFIAAGLKPPATAFRFLQKMRRSDGSLRYSPRYATTPLWVSGRRCRR
jgi:Uncharacterized protein conserved in archaea